jgi:uncharacterized membrane protein YgdD (TMEM256/DUF423 family)
MRFQAATGAIFAGLAVVLGAFGAHALRGTMTPENLAIFKTGTEYQLYHGLALLLLAALHGRLACGHRAAISGWLFAAGVLVFSGSLYALAMTGIMWLGAITPIGGVCMIAGWIVLAINAFFAPDQSAVPNPQSER